MMRLGRQPQEQIRAFNLGIIKRKHWKSSKVVTGLFEVLKRGYDTIAIPRGAFLEANGPTELLALAGFNTGGGNPWIAWIHWVSALNGGFVQPENITLPASEEQTKELIRDNVLTLTPEKV